MGDPHALLDTQEASVCSGVSAPCVCPIHHESDRQTVLKAKGLITLVTCTATSRTFMTETGGIEK